MLEAIVTELAGKWKHSVAGLIRHGRFAVTLLYMAGNYYARGGKSDSGSSLGIKL